ncbi:helix-turn-helix domain-containing protein [Actinacidiphila sp. ITFR-21]|uniref:helix-turn-helix domain-containing protein n=1 Tax=Actinacidiphila sp. ITFR-21 TaxID=3075199 RepID=UPI002889AEC3|nr:helix-turn-helix domain-containing protein [Streptomyces sp. ITFR-21]WNI18474.1 helix-turn-helix domain-containing protein [Streptomyces sp. ITFR-21]
MPESGGPGRPLRVRRTPVLPPGAAPAIPPHVLPAVAHPEGGAALPAQRRLGLTLYRLRLEHELSLRALARLLGYSAHSVFVDVERGQRLPSEALVGAYERAFGLPPGSLLNLRRQALTERVERLTDARSRTLEPASAVPLPVPPAAPASRWLSRSVRVASALVRLPAAVLSLARLPEGRPAGAATAPDGSRLTGRG